VITDSLMDATAGLSSSATPFRENFREILHLSVACRQCRSRL